jgi:peptidoglycan/xylan/chitin deacetylase (PgdA/CDA1 family)
MRKRVRNDILALFYYSGLVSLIRWWTQRSGHSLVILYYHSAIGKNLRRQWLYLRRHYRILPLEAALKELSVPQRVQRKDRRTLLAITFDDGYHDNYTHAFALATELEIPITVFLVPGYIGCADSFWWVDRIIRLTQVETVSFEEHIYHLNQLEERKALAQSIGARMSNAESADVRKKLLISICELLKVPFSVLPKEEPASLLTWTQVREMEESGWVSFGAHTVHHPDLGCLTDPVQVQREVEECRAILEQQLGHPVNTFAYPYGHLGDHGLRAVQQSGYQWAFTTVPGFNTYLKNPHLLCRIRAEPYSHLAIVATETAGMSRFFTYLKGLAQLLIRPLHRIGNVLMRTDGTQTEKERIAL